MTNLRDEAHWLVSEIAAATAMAKALGKPQLGTSSIESGKIEEYDNDNTLVQIIGEQHDGTHIAASVAGPTPPEPVAATATVGFGSAELRWNGKFAEGAMSPMDFSHVSAHGSRLAVFSPDNTTKLADIAGESGDVATVLLEPGEWTIGLVAVSKSGKWSEMSETITIEILDFPSPVDIQQDLIDLDEKYDGVITEAGNLGTRLEGAETALQAAESSLVETGARLDDVFGQVGGAVADAGSALAAASSALTMAGSKSRVYYSTSTPSGTAGDRDVWRQMNSTKDVIGEWFWDATLSTPGWVKTLISSQSISNLDVGKLTVGTGIISDLVAEHIAGRSARFIQLDVSQLVAVTGTMSEAVITKLFTDVVMSRKITAQMIAVGDFQNLATIDPVRNVNVSVPAEWATVTDGDYTRSVGGSYIMFKDRTDTVPFKAGDELRIDFDAVTGGQTGQSITPRIWTYYSKVGDAQVNGPSFTGSAFTIGAVEQHISTTLKIGSGLSVEAKSWIFGLFGAGIPNVKVRNVRVYRMNSGEMVIDGSLKAIKIDIDDLVADTGYIAKLTAKIVKSDMFVGKEFIGGIFTGSTFQTSILPNVGMKIDGDGFRFFGPNGGLPIVEMGASGVKTLGTTDPATGEQLVTFDEEGGASFQTLTVADTARIDGVLVTGGDPLTEGHLGGDEPGSAGPVLNGRSLFGSTYMNYVDEHPTVVDGNSWLTPLPHGPKVNAWRERTGTDYWDGIGGQTHSRMMVTTTLNAVANRAYLVTWQGPAIRETGTVGTGSLGAAVLRKSVPGGSVAAEQGTPVAGQRVYLPRGGAYFNPQGTTVLRCPEDISEGKIMLGVDVYVNAGRQAESTTASGANLWSISAIDVGLRMSANDGVMVDLQKQGTATPTPPPAPAPDPVRQSTLTEPNTWHRSFNSNGTPYDLANLAGKAVQGLGPGATGGAKGAMIGFPSFESFTDGSKTVITKVEVFLYAEHWYAGTGGTLNIGYHGATARPGAFAETVASIKSQKMKRGQGLWITLPSSVHAAVKAGTFGGVTLRPPSNSTSSAYYGYINPSKAGMRARVRVTIRK